jgi:hypothetical protein
LSWSARLRGIGRRRRPKTPWLGECAIGHVLRCDRGNQSRRRHKSQPENVTLPNPTVGSCLHVRRIG